MLVKPVSQTVAKLLGNPNEQYVVPAYQRRYSWQAKQLNELLNDILALENGDGHLLGTVVCLVGPYGAGLNQLEVVDGQQRITTLNILLHCILERLRRERVADQAAKVAAMLESRAEGGVAHPKILLDTIDATEFERHVKQRPVDGRHNANLALAFALYRERVDAMTLSELNTLLQRLTRQATIIRLEVANAKDAFKLFETINNRGLRLNATDIIKNFILGNAARFGDSELAEARVRWAELIAHLDGTNFESFFRHYVSATLTRRVTRAYVVTYFKAIFLRQVLEARTLPEQTVYADEPELEDADNAADTEAVADDEEVQMADVAAGTLTFTAFLERLAQHAKMYGAIVRAKTGVPKIDRRLRHLRMIQSSQTYGFLMAMRAGGCSDANFVEILALTEAFLMRRHICRERANENESMFAKLCGADASDPVPVVRAAYRALSPSDDLFESRFAEYQFTANVMDRARYCLEQFEQGEHSAFAELHVAGTDDVHVEHIIPQKIKTRKAVADHGDWVVYLGDKAVARHRDYVSRIGNLTLFAGTLNISASNNPYGRKKTAYEQSGIKLTQQLPADFPEFRFEEVESRSAGFAKRAVGLWPMA
ncbi:DUF262 domain-containing protein [Achromobacter sp. GG226]|uniref:DUF262 domain-containing protein n=1 Tax=Verticiella alkaliphila TaxID=2779529 RepID=UPI001C0DAAC8|nr:DUF262 domain-containing protein [Verticiella sp. GG226]